MPRTPITAVIHFTIRGMFGPAYREHVQKKAKHLYIKGWLRWLPEHSEIMVGIAIGEPSHVRVFADVLGRNEITSGEVSEMDCFRWEEDISDHEQALILHGLQGFDLK